tara:strand:- start:2447 stop:2734 length:288 start_codon:yes stop_codon:yes gene_type:complete
MEILLDNYLLIVCVLEFLIFGFFYLAKREEHNYLDLQIFGFIAALVWPVTSFVLGAIVIAAICVLACAAILKFITYTLDTVFSREPYKRPDNRTW